MAGPFGIVEGDFFSAEARMHPAPDRMQIAFDDELAAGSVADRPGNRRFQRVETEQNEQHGGQENDRDERACPFQNSHPHFSAKYVPKRMRRRWGAKAGPRPVGSPGPWPAIPGTTRAPFP